MNDNSVETASEPVLPPFMVECDTPHSSGVKVHLYRLDNTMPRRDGSHRYLGPGDHKYWVKPRDGGVGFDVEE